MFAMIRELTRRRVQRKEEEPDRVISPDNSEIQRRTDKIRMYTIILVLAIYSGSATFRLLDAMNESKLVLKTLEVAASRITKAEDSIAQLVYLNTDQQLRASQLAAQNDLLGKNLACIYDMLENVDPKILTIDKLKKLCRREELE